jgi:hypothetical protein
VLKSLGAGGALAWMAFPVLAVLLPTLFASFYVSYRDVFGTP